MMFCILGDVMDGTKTGHERLRYRLPTMIFECSNVVSFVSRLCEHVQTCLRHSNKNAATMVHVVHLLTWSRFLRLCPTMTIGHKKKVLQVSRTSGHHQLIVGHSAVRSFISFVSKKWEHAGSSAVAFTTFDQCWFAALTAMLKVRRCERELFSQSATALPSLQGGSGWTHRRVYQRGRGRRTMCKCWKRRGEVWRQLWVKHWHSTEYLDHLEPRAHDEKNCV